MKRLLAPAFSLIASVFFSAAGASDGAILIDGDPQAGAEIAAACATCHGPDGNSVNPQWPSLAGQGAPYLAKQLYNFQNPETSGRNNAIMYGQAVALEDDDIASLAVYYAELTMNNGFADPELAARGEQLYRAGDAERGLPACSGCHSPRGLGNAAAAFPRLGGQHAEYLSMQLQAFRSGERANDPNQMMRDVAAKLSDDDIAALASYLQGLR